MLLYAQFGIVWATPNSPSKLDNELPPKSFVAVVIVGGAAVVIVLVVVVTVTTETELLCDTIV